VKNRKVHSTLTLQFFTDQPLTPFPAPAETGQAFPHGGRSKISRSERLGRGQLGIINNC
jgi:hypothetical protein